MDVALGDGFYLPLPLREGEYTHGPYTYGMRPSEVVSGGWRFDHDSAGAFVGFDFAPRVATMADFAEKYAWLSSSPGSGFVRLCILMRRDATGVDYLKALTLNRHGKHEVLESSADWWAAVGDVFGISAALFTAEERDRLWRRVVAQHGDGVDKAVITT